MDHPVDTPVVTPAERLALIISPALAVADQLDPSAVLPVALALLVAALILSRRRWPGSP